jgi:RNA polymerase sigma-70 factor (ECF subfamily)
MLEFHAGSRDAFEQLYARYQRRLCAFFQRRLPNPARAEDLTQEVFLAVINGAARYRPQALFRTYLYAIAMNSLLAERRKQTRDSGAGEGGREAAVRHAPDESLWLREALQRLEPVEREILMLREYDELSYVEPVEREILMLREYDELSYVEMADLLNLPLNTVRSRLFRARTALRQLLQGSPHGKGRAVGVSVRLDQNLKGEACDA